MSREKRTEMMSVVVTKKEKAAIQRRAQKSGMSVHRWMYETVKNGGTFKAVYVPTKGKEA